MEILIQYALKNRLNATDNRTVQKCAVHIENGKIWKTQNFGISSLLTVIQTYCLSSYILDGLKTKKKHANAYESRELIIIISLPKSDTLYSIIR